MSSRHEIHIFYVGSGVQTSGTNNHGNLVIHRLKSPLSGVAAVGWLASRLTSQLTEGIKREGRFDAVLSDLITPYSRNAVEASEALSIPLFSDYADFEFYHSSPVYRIVTTSALRAAFSRSKHTFAVSESLGERLRDVYGVPESMITLIPNGVDTAAFHPYVNSTKKQELGLSGKCVVGFCGSLNQWVRLDLLINAVKMLAQDYDDIRLLVVGDGPELERWRRLAVALGVQDRVVFAGGVSHENVPDYVSVFDVAVSVFSKDELVEPVIPLKVLEYMSMGKAVVADDFRGTRSVISDMRNGVLFEPESPESILDSLEMLLRDESLRITLGAEARRDSLAYDWRVLSSALEAKLTSHI
jgi:glycosyltransferase involved in cell wall biosynthesis